MIVAPNYRIWYTGQRGTRHNVTPEEVEEVCFGNPLILKSKQDAKGRNPLYYALGRTESGRYLFIVFIRFKHGRAMVVTARDMNQYERKYYQRKVEK
ncbi:MAG TPA: BrnT family toxin [Desulfotomaculum sp.]|nr:BrnT family toxin [Desulfotomaculum sp.]